MNIYGTSQHHFSSFREEFAVKASFPMEIYVKIFDSLDPESLRSISMIGSSLHRLEFETAKQIRPSPIIDLTNLLRDSLKESYPIQSQKLSEIVRNQERINCINLSQIKSSLEKLKHEIAHVLKELKEEDLQKLKEDPNFSGEEAAKIIELGEIYQKDSMERNFALSLMAQESTKNHQLEEANELIDQIDDLGVKQLAWKDMVKKLAQEKKFEKAIEMADKIAPSSIKSLSALQVLLDKTMKIQALQEGVLEELMKSDRPQEADKLAEELTKEMKQEIDQAIKEKERLNAAIDLMEENYHSSKMNMSAEQKEKTESVIAEKIEEVDKLDQGIEYSFSLLDQLEDRKEPRG